MTRAAVWSAVLWGLFLGAPLLQDGAWAEAEGRWVWGRGRGDLQKRKYVAGGIDDGFLQEGPGVGVLGGNGVKFGLGSGPGAIGGGGGPGYQPPPFNRPPVQPPPVHEGPVLAGPGGPIGVPGYRPGGLRPGIGGPGIGGPGYPGPGIGGPGYPGPGIGGPGYPGPGIGGPGFKGPGFGGPGFPGPGGIGGGGPGFGGPGIPGPGGPGFGPHGNRPGILTGPVPSWEQERLDALGVGHRYHSFDTCSCVHSFNCKEPALKFGKCDKDKQYCCNGIRPATEGHGVPKPHFGGPHQPHPGPPPPPPPGLYPGNGPFPGPYPGPEFARSAKATDKKL